MARRIECPFIIADYFSKRNELKLTCEQGKLTFNDRESFMRYVTKYCASVCGWRNCSLAVNLQEYYERKDKEENE